VPDPEPRPPNGFWRGVSPVALPASLAWFDAFLICSACLSSWSNPYSSRFCSFAGTSAIALSAACRPASILPSE
jgi:hypothetical protein